MKVQNFRKTCKTPISCKKGFILYVLTHNNRHEKGHLTSIYKYIKDRKRILESPPLLLDCDLEIIGNCALFALLIQQNDLK